MNSLRGFHQSYYHPSNVPASISTATTILPAARGRLPQGSGAARRTPGDPLQARWGEPRRSCIPTWPHRRRRRPRQESDARRQLAAACRADGRRDDPGAEHPGAPVGTLAAPLLLIDSGLGEDLTGAGLMDHLRQVAFSTGLKGSPGKTTRSRRASSETLRGLADGGFDPTRGRGGPQHGGVQPARTTPARLRGLSLMLRAPAPGCTMGRPARPARGSSKRRSRRSARAGAGRYSKT